ncbi:MAG: radical SAM protein [Spirochaetia bacterium]|nr:radical SAM protein [Spirochaetia bacterium]
MELNTAVFNKEQGVLSSPVRSFKKLRVSITENCNLACLYCDVQKARSQSPLKNDLSALLEIIKKLNDRLDLSSVRITGGEPALNPNLVSFVQKLKQLGIPEINLTSNGIFLGNLLVDLRQAGLDRINISLDALDDVTYYKITGRKGVDQVIHSIYKARETGFDVKLNSIILRGINENQVLPLLEFAIESSVKLRFLELMKMGPAADRHSDFYYSRDEILSQVQTRYYFSEMAREASSTARYYQIGSQFSFGIIANHSDPFCEDCDRLRLDHKGNLYGCLSNSSFFRMPEKNDKQYNLILDQAMALKQKKEFTGSILSMRHIGG